MCETVASSGPRIFVREIKRVTSEISGLLSHFDRFAVCFDISIASIDQVNSFAQAHLIRCSHRTDQRLYLFVPATHVILGFSHLKRHVHAMPMLPGWIGGM